MKKIFFVAMALLPVLYFSAGCKKNNEIDTTSSFKNMVWTGTFHYTGDVDEPYSLKFREDSSFLWFEYNGLNFGTWKLDEKKLTLTFSAGKPITAAVSDGKTLANIQNDHANARFVNSGELNTTVDQKLEGTTWKEKNNLGTLTFNAFKNVTTTGIFAIIPQNSSYVGDPGAIYCTSPLSPGNSFFAVVMSDGKTMRFVNKYITTPYHPYVMIKQ